MNDTNPNPLQAIEEDIHHLLAGAFKANPARMEAVLSYPHWQEKARQELERRHIRLLEALDDETLQALAEGKIDLGRVAARAAEKDGPDA